MSSFMAGGSRLNLCVQPSSTPHIKGRIDIGPAKEKPNMTLNIMNDVDI